MSKPSQRPSREEIERRKEEVRLAQQELREKQKAAGMVDPPRVSIPNCTSPLKTVEEEQAAREKATTEQARIIRTRLPTLLKRFSQIEDPRQPIKAKHKLTVILIYGILTFVFQCTSRREANRTLTRAMFKENLYLLFPDLESIPHHDTVNRLLCDIDVNQIKASTIRMSGRPEWIPGVSRWWRCGFAHATVKHASFKGLL